MPRFPGLLVASAVALLGCADPEAEARDEAPSMAFDTTVVHLVTGADTTTVRAEVARSTEQRTMGLMERRSLAENAGMLFVYPDNQPATSGFWMYRTRIPLDIAFADSTGRIVAVRRMEPCEAQLIAGCPTYEPGHAYRTALEVNAGFFARHGIGVGSRLSSPALQR